LLTACQGGSGGENTDSSKSSDIDDPAPSLPDDVPDLPQPDEVTPPDVEVIPSYGFDNLGLQHEGYSILSTAFRLYDRNDKTSKQGLSLSDIIVSEGAAEIGLLDFLSLDEVPAADIQSDIIILIDIGSSFSESEIESIKSSVIKFSQAYLSESNLDNKISIYTFDSDVKASLDQTSRLTEIEDFIASIDSDVANRKNSTNLYGAFENILAEVDVEFTRKASRYDAVFLITDGIHNSDNRAAEFAESLIINSNKVKKNIIPLVLKDNATKEYFSDETLLFPKIFFSEITSELDVLFTQAHSYFNDSKKGIYRATYVTPKRLGINALSIKMLNNPECEVSELLCNDALTSAFDADGFEDTPPVLEIFVDAVQDDNNRHYVDDKTVVKVSAKLSWALGEYKFIFDNSYIYNQSELLLREKDNLSADYYVPAKFFSTRVEVSEATTGLTNSVYIKGDIDQDGHYNHQDDMPYDPTEHLDTDEDGIGNNADLDDDNDLFSDVIDQYPLDEDKSADTHISLNDLSPMSEFYRGKGLVIPLGGYSMDGLGDVNGDGFADVVIGNATYAYRHYNYNGTSYWRDGVGRAYIIFGNDDSDISEIPTWDRESFNGSIYQGSERYKYIGNSVTGVGDLNGDGTNDLVMGTPANGKGPDFLHHSGRTYFVTSNIRKGQNSFYSAKGYLGAGSVVKAAGDVNGDGYPDVVMKVNSSSYQNQLIVSYSHKISETVDHNDMSRYAGYKISSTKRLTPYEGIGDINGDGYDDLRVYAKYGNHYIIWGGRRNFSRLDLDDFSEGSVFSISGGLILNENSGDINKDGLSDVVVSYNGIAKVIYGKTEGFESNTMEQFIAMGGVEILGAKIKSVEFIPDFNGDGLDDMLIEDKDSLKVIFGKEDFSGGIPFSNIMSNDGIEISMSGEGNTEYYSKGIGDFNGDGYGDIMVGRGLSNKVYIKFGFSQPQQDLEAAN